jgi:hypothetical protein
MTQVVPVQQSELPVQVPPAGWQAPRVSQTPVPPSEALQRFEQHWAPCVQLDPLATQAVPASVGIPQALPPPACPMQAVPAQQAEVPVPPAVQVVPGDRQEAG